MTLDRQIWVAEERLELAKREGASQDRIERILDRLEELYQERQDQDLVKEVVGLWR